MLIAIGVVNVALGIHRERSLTTQLIDGLFLILLVVTIFVIVDFLVWRSTEKEWHGWHERRIAEQAGTGQPATRSLSDSEGSHKPQPEAEGRSR
jgi:hypothetical protein